MSSAHRSKVQPLATSKRAWCQGQVRMPSSIRPSIERKAHMRAAVVERHDAAAIANHEDRAMAAPYHEPA